MKYVVFDVETPNERNDRMSSIGICVVENGKITEEFYTLVNPETYFNAFNVSLTGISAESVKDAPIFPEVFKAIKTLLDDAVLVAHNAPFDMGVLSKCMSAYGISWKSSVDYACTCKMARRILPQLPSKRLNALCDYFGIELDHHNALSDARAAAKLLLCYEMMGHSPEKFIAKYNFF